MGSSAHDTLEVWLVMCTALFCMEASLATQVTQRTQMVSCVFCTKVPPCPSSWNKQADFRPPELAELWKSPLKLFINEFPSLWDPRTQFKKSLTRMRQQNELS